MSLVRWVEPMNMCRDQQFNEPDMRINVNILLERTAHGQARGCRWFGPSSLYHILWFRAISHAGYYCVSDGFSNFSSRLYFYFALFFIIFSSPCMPTLLQFSSLPFNLYYTHFKLLFPHPSCHFLQLLTTSSLQSNPLKNSFSSKQGMSSSSTCSISASSPKPWVSRSALALQLLHFLYFIAANCRCTLCFFFLHQGCKCLWHCG